MNRDSLESRSQAELDDGLDKRNLSDVPETREPETREPETREPETREPEMREPEMLTQSHQTNEASDSMGSDGQPSVMAVRQPGDEGSHGTGSSVSRDPDSLVDPLEPFKLSGEVANEDLETNAAGEELTLFGFYEPQEHPKLRHAGEESSSISQLDEGLNLESDENPDQTHGRPAGQDPLRQSLFLLATMAVMLLAVRYFVPRIVEEIRYSWHRGELRAEYETGSEGLRNVSLDTLSRAYQMVTSTVGPSVVHIDVKQPSSVTDMKIQGRVIPFYAPKTDQGSGVIVAENGFLLTNRHVIMDGDEIYVTLGDGRRLNAAIVGTDKQTDLAVLKVEAEGLIPIAWGDSDRCRVGSPVWAVGSPFGLDQTVTFGILSGKHRLVEDSTHYQDFMQSDVAVNPGNSGGPLVDARGALVGINTAIVGESYQGVSFAVPSNVAKQVYDRIREIGRVDRGWLGVRLSEVEDGDLVGNDHRMRGAVVRGLTNDSSPAALAGLKLGDHILTVDRTAVRDLPHLMRLIGGSLAGSDITLEVLREGQPLTLTVVLGARPNLLNQP
jgi:S1-C subfamily serine protease